ncbi:MAG: asparagine synthase [Flavobacteriales bacterium CG03_land_8_20_14_0_80_35_15]|nr:asparagine synthetase B family protein [Zetaproteobacteria bacterium]NDK18822.1 asparagine synthetase B family protein [Flavobacteriales bacterium]OIO09797.1 MAG: asparagine synthase [Flavobacteriaceae bacterium CG1_02_35_72]PIR14537.1 MAG: asparagine synthase [Flavobacteriales bacterium CG11_big_fil_rev_8_21_14_0_20_35_7]PIV17660.1 MAG: asparagine synthase [Flavobacteriales bacterium CG03_land_8_20_14_0_80_35_15]PIX06756.1 MAG: asparagine synthase [Flavobacteriales bacterium CG_4_8_14_3_um
MNSMYVSKVIDLTNPKKNSIYNRTHEEAVNIVKSGDVEAVRKIDGQFALVSVEGKTIRMARSIGRPLRYFIAKRAAGPQLVIAERIDVIYNYLKKEGMDDQFHPSYTRMVPAHYITKIELLGCPDPNPIYTRFFTPQRNKFSPNHPEQIGKDYIGVVYQEIKKWLQFRAKTGPIGITFSAGIDSGSIFLLTYHALKELGESPSRLKAFTLSIDGDGADLMQARKFLKALNLELFLEPIELDYAALNWHEAIDVVEDYKPLDIQSATMNLALLHGIRSRYPEWKYLIDGDGGDENLKDYPIEANPELTIRSVLNNLMLYHEGWGVESIKHSLTYSGGLSRGYMRTFSPADLLNFEGFSPYTLPNAIEISEGIPYIEMTDWDHQKLYKLKGQIVAAGVKAITGMEMPVFEKRRFQHGAASSADFNKHFPAKEIDYRKAFLSKYE